MEIVNELYSKYINDNQYVYYKEHGIVIIMKKISNFKCVCNINPKKYYSDNLKVILMFNILDPYKLVLELQKYKINEIVESEYYDYIKEAYTLYQEYWNMTGNKKEEYNTGDEEYINCRMSMDDGAYYVTCRNINGLYQRYYVNGQIMIIGNYINAKRNGLYQHYYDNGQIMYECNYINDIMDGIYREYNDNGQCVRYEIYK